MEELARRHPLPSLDSRTLAIILTHKSLELPPVNTHNEEDPLKDSEQAERVMAAEAAYAVVQRSEKIKVETFKAYIGAAYQEHGLEVITKWFEAIVPKSLEDARVEDEERIEREEALRTAMENANINEPNRPVTPPSQHGTSNPGSPTSPQPAGSGGLALFNEICTQKKLTPKWVEAKQGAAHQPTFKAVVTLTGESLINTVVTSTLERERPLSRRGDLADKRILLTSKERVSYWSDAYGLPTRLNARADQESTLRNENITAKVEVFQAYVGALFRLHDFRVLEDWLMPVVKESLEDIEIIEEANNLPDPGFDQSTIGIPNAAAANVNNAPDIENPHIPPPNVEPRNGSIARNSQDGPKIGLGFFNEQCNKHRIEPQWGLGSEGPSHKPTHTATTGTGKTRSEAKHKAAAQAIRALGWVSARGY
ncbi:17032_t:CDS:2 [Acaulospora colombiana]|uniref:17032_t:CDS:1 n=1 Tax=Acaulospora colombiana TaxID=27376 RepID=A0ACA9NBI5_9GLOM|nr:17032_t:CDS:2 [Acaulospora colombiana]